MKIITLQAENIKKLVAVEIKPEGALVQITGKNSSGKSSTLDSIWWALGGLANVQGRPIRQGATEGFIRLDLGEIVVTRTLADDGEGGYTSSIRVENKDGARFPSPQKVLDDLLGALTFDPLAFARMKPRDQFDQLKRFVPGVDFDALDAEHQAEFDKRTSVNRLVRQEQAAAEAVAVPLDAPVAEVDERALVAAMQEAAAFNTELEGRKGRRANAAQEIENQRRTAQNLLDQARAAKEKADELEKKLAAAEPLPQPRDVSKIAADLDLARAANASFRQAQERKSHLEKAKAYQEDAEALTKRMEANRARKQEAIAAAKLPVAGLGFGDGEVTLNGLPFAQASGAEQLRVSTAVAMSLNPKLRVLCVKDASLLDEESLKAIEAMAKDGDYQVWLERVDSSGKVGFVLEDGRVKGQEIGAKPEPKKKAKSEKKEAAA